MLGHLPASAVRHCLPMQHSASLNACWTSLRKKCLCMIVNRSCRLHVYPPLFVFFSFASVVAVTVLSFHLKHNSSSPVKTPAAGGSAEQRQMWFLVNYSFITVHQLLLICQKEMLCKQVSFSSIKYSLAQDVKVNEIKWFFLLARSVFCSAIKGLPHIQTALKWNCVVSKWLLLPLVKSFIKIIQH